MDKKFYQLIKQNKWVFAKTMPEIPHYYIVRGDLAYDEKKIFDEFSRYIKENGYTKNFYSKEYTYLDIGGYKYWVIDDILNRARI